MAWMPVGRQGSPDERGFVGTIHLVHARAARSSAKDRYAGRTALRAAGGCHRLGECRIHEVLVSVIHYAFVSFVPPFVSFVPFVSFFVSFVSLRALRAHYHYASDARVFSTSSACPGTLTLSQRRATLPSPAIRHVVRAMPISAITGLFLPHAVFLGHGMIGIRKQREVQPVLAGELRFALLVEDADAEDDGLRLSNVGSRSGSRTPSCVQPGVSSFDKRRGRPAARRSQRAGASSPD